MSGKADAIARGALQDAELDRLADSATPDPYEIAALAMHQLAAVVALLTSARSTEREAGKRQVKTWVRRFAGETD